jgi:membrane fusion protein, multidrug efflux system
MITTTRLLVLTLPLALLVSCGSPREARKKDGGTATAPVEAAAVAMMEWPATYEATGTVRARTASVISSKVMGYVREVKVQAGDRVQAGQLLVALDARDLEAAEAQAEAAVREAQGAAVEAGSAVNAARASLELARVTFGRMKDLFEKKSVSNQEFDEASARLKVADANHRMAVSKSSQVAARIQQAEEARRATGIMRGYAEIKAPFAGTVTEKKVDLGTLAAPGMPLLTLEQSGSYRLEASVEESRLAQVRAGQRVTVVLDSLDKAIPARVSEVVPAVDAASRAFVVKIDLPATSQWRSGMFGRAQFPLGSRKVLAVPAGAVVEQGQVQSVYVVEDGRARSRLITTGAENQGQVEVLSGLAVADKVVFPVPPSLRDGAAVEVRP